MAQTSQFTLLRKRRFLPFFITQFAGAFNDNLYKNALLLLIAFSSGSVWGLNSNVVINLAAGLFILPFFLFSALAGQVADKYEKSHLIRWIKVAEILIMSAAAVGFLLGWYGLLLGLLFIMGVHSSFFGPVKYAILPQAVLEEELVGGNALVEMGTFVAILLGTLAAGFLTQLPHEHLISALAVLLTAVAGFAASLGIPRTPAADPAIRLNFNPWTETWRVVGLARRSHDVFLALMGISWFWFLGAAYLTQFPNFAHLSLHGDKSVVTVLLATFTIGIGVGSLVCERLSGHRLELGIVPMGALGITLFGVDLYFAAQALANAGTLDWLGLFSRPSALRVLVDLLGIGVFGGVFIVPLYAFIQAGTPPDRRARIIAANNILNALFMVGSALAGVLFLGMLHLTISHFFLVLSLLNAIAAALLFWRMPAFWRRFRIWLRSRRRYRMAHQGLEAVPTEGACVMLCNRDGFPDILALTAILARPVYLLVDEPPSRQHPDTDLLEWIKLSDDQTAKKIGECLAAGHLLCAVNPDSETNWEALPLPVSPVPVVPVRLSCERGLSGRRRLFLSAGPALKVEMAGWRETLTRASDFLTEKH